MLMRFNRVLLKLSGEVLAGSEGFGFDFDAIRSIGEEIVEVVRSGIQVAMVVGGGNMLRGRELEKLGIERSQGDYMGMLA
ncbi:MAG: UMP kinase, partial [Synergistaceae bacterium]|nr:UMP kinase [Synergistaceae bacterium]